jgi:hypothetical protein
VLTAALVREHRLRRALERLLSKIVYAWRNQHGKDWPGSIQTVLG